MRTLTWALAGVPVRVACNSRPFERRVRRLYRHLQQPDLAASWLEVTVEVGSAPALPDGPPTLTLDGDRLVLGWLDPNAERLILSDGRTHATVEYPRDVVHLRLAEESEEACFAAAHRIFPVALGELLRQRGVYYLHAGAIAHPTQDLALLLLGDSGAGKSTFTYRALAAGWRYIADDGVLLSRATGRFRASAFYSQFCLDPKLLRPEHRDATFEVEPTKTGRRVALTPNVLPITESGQIFASFILERRPMPPSACTSTTRGEVMRELLRQNGLVPLHSGLAPRHLAALASLTRETSPGILSLAHDLLESDDVLQELLDQATRLGVHLQG